jgi:hypothetical protein
MGYSEWVAKHAKKHQIIVKKLRDQNYTQEMIIEYFDFESMKVNEQDFCPLYAKNKKCHDMDSLNCYLCSCPNFRFNDDGIKKIKDKIEYSFCSIHSKDGKQGIYGTKIHQDCSQCQVPHHKAYVQQHFSYDWMQIMQPCTLKEGL